MSTATYKNLIKSEIYEIKEIMPFPRKKGLYYSIVKLEEILTQSDCEEEFIARNVSDDSADEIDTQVLQELSSNSPKEAEEVADEEPEEINEPVHTINENVSWEFWT